MHLTTTFHPHRVPFQDAPIYVCVKDSVENHNQRKMLHTISKKKQDVTNKQPLFSRELAINYLNARTWMYGVGRHGKEMGRGLHDKQHISTFTACAWLCVVTSQPTLSLAVASVLCFCVALLVLRVKPTRWWVIKFSTSGSTTWIKAQFGPEAPLLEWTSKLLQAQLGWTEREN